MSLIPIHFVILCAFLAAVGLAALGAARILMSPFGLTVAALVVTLALVVAGHH